MLLPVFKLVPSPRLKVPFLLAISLFTFHSNAFADIALRSAEEYRAAGYQAQQKGDYSAALSQFTKAMALGLESGELFNDMAVLNEQIGFNSRAEQYYLKAIALDPAYLPPYMNLAYFYKKNGKTQEAVKYFIKRYELDSEQNEWTQKSKEEILKIKPQYQNIILMREAQRMDKDVEEDVQREFAARIARSQEHYNQGMKHSQLSEYQMAIEEFDKALVLTPRNTKVMTAREDAQKELLKSDIKMRSDMAVQMLNTGDFSSARTEIQKMLTAVEDKSQ